eukprot:6017763-Alexandrium_andersonii.AAC.1
MAIVDDEELVLALSELEQVLLFVLAIAAEPLVVPRQVALGRDHVGLEVALVLHAVSGNAVPLMGEALLCPLRATGAGPRSQRLRSVARWPAS